MSAHQPINETIANAVEYFMEAHSVTRINRSLSKLLFGYLRSQREGLCNDFDEVIHDLEVLQELLHVIEDRA